MWADAMIYIVGFTRAVGEPQPLRKVTNPALPNRVRAE